ncbi:MAG: dolichyl-phosphate beta-glucosyltransferase [Thermodesulfobacteriota bacterium]
MSSTRPFLSLVMPAYNEEQTIGRSVSTVRNYLMKRGYPFEIIVVDDGSEDQTLQRVQEVMATCEKIRLVRNRKNLGKGAAVRKGMLHAEGEYIVFSDVDLSVSIDQIEPFLENLRDGYNIAIGSRRLNRSHIQDHQPIYREMMGRAFTRLSRWILGTSTSDFTCGFKGFQRDVARDLFAVQRLPDWSFDSEVIYLAGLRGYKIAQIPVTWSNGKETKVRLLRDIPLSLFGLLRIRLNKLMGKYGP